MKGHLAIRDPGRRQIPASLSGYLRSPGWGGEEEQRPGLLLGNRGHRAGPSARLDEELSKGDSFRGLSFPYFCIPGKSVRHPGGPASGQDTHPLSNSSPFNSIPIWGWSA